MNKQNSQNQERLDAAMAPITTSMHKAIRRQRRSTSRSLSTANCLGILTSMPITIGVLITKNAVRLARTLVWSGVDAGNRW